MSNIVSIDQGPVRTLALNRPDVRNALSRELRAALRDALEDAARDDAVRAVVLTGEGAAFCAGLDLRELAEIATEDAESSRRDARQLADLLLRIHTLPKPVVAALNGAAVAGGAGLASACDIVVADEHARIGYTESRIGFVAALVGVLLSRQVGDRAAREMLLTARLYDATDALRMGLVNEVVPAGTARLRAQEIAAEVAANAASSVALTKSLLAALPGMGLEDGMRFAVEVNALARGTSDLREGVAAFLEKREPAWRTTTLDQNTDPS